MKDKMKFLNLLLFFPCLLSGEIEFAGIFHFQSEPRFSLIETEEGARSGWVQVGASFQGYRIESYDSEDGVLRLASSEETLHLTLRSAVVQATRTSLENIFRSRVVAEMGHDEVLATGGFRDLAGNHLYAFVEPEEATSADARAIQLRLKLFSVPEEVMREVGLDSLATDERTTEKHQIWSRDDFRQAEEFLRQASRVDILTLPAQTVQSGDEAAAQLGNLKLLTIPALTEDRSGFQIDFTWEQPKETKQSD